MSFISSGTTSLSKPYHTLIGALLPIPFLLLYIFSIYKSPLYIIAPKANLVTEKYNLTTLSDTIDGGNTNIQVLTYSPTQLRFKYTLKQGFVSPYANIQICKSDSTFLDLNAYGKINIKIKATKGRRIPLYLASYAKNNTNPTDRISYRYSLINLNVKDVLGDFLIPFEDLHTPDWWYISNHKTEQDFGDPDYSKVQYLYFTHCINIAKDQEDIVDVEEISFHMDWLKKLLPLVIALLCYYGLFAFLRFRKKSPIDTKVNFQYEKVSSRNHQDAEEEKVFAFLKAHYTQQELSIIDVQSATGLHERKISSLIKKKTDLNFKQFLNGLRITEAKRMLLESKLPISDIAFQVGYANASHFNRVFKSIENCSPNDFRKEHSDPFTKGE